MAYINAESTKAIRENLKKAFPSIKFSVKNQHHSTVAISIMASSLELNAHTLEAIKNYGNASVSPYWLDQSDYCQETKETLMAIFDIANKGNHNNSDSQSDYFDVGWYVNLEFGQWNKPYIAK